MFSRLLEIFISDPVIQTVEERSAAKNYCPVSLISVVSKVFEKLVSDRAVNHLKKCGLFSDFQYGFSSCQSTADFLAVLSDRIANVFNRSGAIRTVALDVSKAFDWMLHDGLLHKHKILGNFRSDILPYFFFSQK